jgi:hypothetical protein
MRFVSPLPTGQPESLFEFVDTSSVSKPFHISSQRVPNLQAFSLWTRQNSDSRSCAARCRATTFPIVFVAMLAVVEISGESLLNPGSFRVNIGKSRCREDG